MKNKTLTVQLELANNSSNNDLMKQCTEYLIKNELKNIPETRPLRPVKRVADKYTKKLLSYLFIGTRGGTNRLRIVLHLAENPFNTHQLSKELKLDYKAIQHHIRVLEKNNIITRTGERYGATFRLSTFLEVQIEAFNEIIAKIAES